ncbi:hypothetical protein SUSAZ_08920 [Sulfolobus acidocaldarius SUSAZ]|nr:hypothetical protein SUSAZ_08920 [Sulfolobus acidocaldarius SUSAZ]
MECLLVFTVFITIVVIWISFVSIPYIQPPDMLIGARISKSLDEPLHRKIIRAYVISSSAV